MRLAVQAGATLFRSWSEKYGGKRWRSWGRRNGREVIHGDMGNVKPGGQRKELVCELIVLLQHHALGGTSVILSDTSRALSWYL